MAKRMQQQPRERVKLDPKRVLAAMGPGLVAALAGADAGGVAAYSNSGALYGFGLLWTVPIMCLLLIVAQETAARMGCVTGKGFASLIREQYGVRPSVVAMLALLISNATVTLSEFAGIASGFALFGIPTFVSVPASAFAIWMLTMSGSYRRIEKVLLAISCVFVTYVVAGFMVGPDWGKALHDTFIPPLSGDLSYLSLIVALVGTTIAPWMIFLAQSNVVERNARERDIPYQRIDTATGSIVASAISWFIILVTGAVLHPAGIVVQGAEDAASALAPLVGQYRRSLAPGSSARRFWPPACCPASPRALSARPLVGSVAATARGPRRRSTGASSRRSSSSRPSSCSCPTPISLAS